jgi:hypothetical protein
MQSDYPSMLLRDAECFTLTNHPDQEDNFDASIAASLAAPLPAQPGSRLAKQALGQVWPLGW